MSNIHGIGQFQDPEPSPQQGGGGGGGQGYDASEGGGGIGLTPPSAFGQIPSISERLLPRFTVKSFTFVVSVIDVMMFIATLIFAGTRGPVFDKDNAMAGPGTLILFLMGGKFGPCIRTGEVYRLVTPIFLHAGIVHLVSNLFFQLHFGFTFEKRWTAPRYIAIYLLTGIGASLLSTAVSYDVVSIGASGSLFGLLGADVVYLFMNWRDIPQNRPEACVLTIVIIMNFVLGFGDSQIDNFAHLGGLITGLFVGAFMCPPITVWPTTRLYQGIGVFLLLVLFTTLTLLIFLSHPLDVARCQMMYA